MRFPLSLHKLDTQQFSGGEGYAVFQPDDVAAGYRARPKFTMDVDQWIEAGKPVRIFVTVSDQDGHEILSHNELLEKSLAHS